MLPKPSSSAQRLSYIGYRLLARFAEILPASAIERVSSVAASAAVRVLPGKVRIISDNLTPVLGTAPSPQLIHDSFASYVRFWLESLRLPAVPAEWLEDHFTVEGLEFMDQAVAEDRPIIVALSHLGNWDIAGAWFTSRGLDLGVVVENLASKELFEWFKGFRESIGLEVLTEGPTLTSQLLQRLKNGGAIALLCDRDVHNSGKPATFFGRQVSIVRGPAVLALRTNAVLLPTAIYQTANSSHRAVISPPIDTTRRGSLSADTERITAELLGIFEDMIRRAPEQWHVFGPYWDRD